MVELLGYIGALMFAFCGLPQLIHTVRTGDASGISWGLLVLWLGGEILTLLYVSLKDSAHVPLVLNYVLNIIMLLALIWIKSGAVFFGKKRG